MTGKKVKTNGEETVVYCIGWCCMAALLVFWLVYLRDSSKIPSLSPCIFLRLTGFYCPGCGGTRALLALFHGRLLRSLIYHPLVPYSFVVGGWFMLSQTIQRLSRGRLAIGMKYRDGYLWAALVIVAASFFIKNILLLWGIRMLQ